MGGQKKTYEYNQYLVPLKRSDNLDCSMEVFIIPQSDIDDLIDEEGQLKDITGQEDEYKRHLAEYETELAELEWKHSQLSKSYKELFNKHNKTRKKHQELEKKVELLESDREKLIKALKKVKEARENDAQVQDSSEALKTVPQQDSNKNVPGSVIEGQVDEVGGQIKTTNFESEKSQEVKGNKESKENKEDKDIWTVLRSRLTKKEEEEK